MGETSNDKQTRCVECGFNIPGGGRTCPMCGALVIGEWASPDNQGSELASTFPETDRNEPPTAWMTTDSSELFVGTVGGDLQPSGEADTSVTAFQPFEETAPNIVVRRAIEEADVVGRVISVEHSHTEPPSFDIFRLLTRLLWGLLFLVAPLILLGPVFLVFGPLSIVAVALGIFFLLRVFSLSNVLWLVHIFGGSRTSERVPVWYARVRGLDDESESMVRLKGLYASGNISPDDIVAFWGSWRDGLLVARRGLNYRTQSTITFQRSKWWIRFVLTLILVAGLGAYLYTIWSEFEGGVAR